MKQAATWPKHSILQMSKLGYQSAFLLNQSKRKMKLELLADLLACIKSEEKFELLTLRKFKFA